MTNRWHLIGRISISMLLALAFFWMFGALAHLIWGWSKLPVTILFTTGIIGALVINIYLTGLRIEKERLAEEVAAMVDKRFSEMQEETAVLREALQERFPPTDRPN